MGVSSLVTLLVGVHAAIGGTLAPCDLDPAGPSAWVLTFSPGTTTETVFGHTAVLVYDPDQEGWSPVYDYGRYQVDSRLEGLVAVLTATQDYHLGTRTLDETLARYGAEGRSVVAQRLDLTPGQLQTLAEALSVDLDDDPSFAYNWYRPNCTTRVQTLVDEVLGGTLEPQHRRPSGWSPARQVLRHSADLWPLWFGLHWGSGRTADTEVSAWDAAFLPDTLQVLLDASLLPDGRPLVERTCLLIDAGSLPVPGEAPERDPWLWGLGLLGAAVISGASAVERRAGLVLVAIEGLVVGTFGGAALAVGLLGTFAPFWGHHNQPFAHLGHLALIAAAAWAWRRPDSRGPAAVAGVLLGVAAAGLVGAAFAGFADRNAGIFGLAVPPLVATLYALRPVR